MEGSEKKQEQLAFTFAYARLLGVLSLEAWLYFCFSYKLKLLWHIFIIYDEEYFYRTFIQVLPSSGAMVLWEFILATMLLYTTQIGFKLASLMPP